MHILRAAAFMLTLLLFATPALAQRPDRGDGQAIKGKVQDVLDKTGHLGDRLAALCDDACRQTPAGAKFSTKVQRLKRAHDRVKLGHGRSDDADFQEFTRRRPKKVDEPQGVITAAPNDPEFDEERGKDVIEDLDEVGAEIDELNSILGGNVPPPPPPEFALDNADYFFPTWMWPSSEVSFAAFTANLAAEKAAAIADHFCDQTAVAVGFGGNGSAACSVVEGVHQVLDAVYQMIDYIGQDVTAAEVTGTYKRAKNIFDQLALADGNIDQMKMVVEAMGQKLLILEENQKRILELLSTPQGQRPGFPVK